MDNIVVVILEFDACIKDGGIFEQVGGLGLHVNSKSMSLKFIPSPPLALASIGLVGINHN